MVVIRSRGSVFGGYEVIESGRLCFDGRQLLLKSDEASRAVTDHELGALQPVTPNNRIPECQSFDLFILV